MHTEPLILFDGVCNFCNAAVNFTIKRDKKNRYKFCPLQSDYGRQLLSEYNFPIDNFKSFVLLEEGKCFTRSTAALRVCKQLSGAWPLLYGFIIVPKFIRDGIYNWIAKNRYKWFGKKDQCMIPTPAVRQRFIALGND